jgi:hypothetical protein
VERQNTVAVMFVLLITSGFVAGTTATFTASTTNSNALATASLTQPLSGSPPSTLRGYAVELKWNLIGGETPDTLDVGYRVRRSDTLDPPADGADPSCVSNVDFTNDSTPFGPNPIDHTTSNSYIDTAIGDPATFAPGRWICYQVETVAPCCTPAPDETNAWTAVSGTAPSYSVQLGNVVQSVKLVGNGSGNLDGDTDGINSGSDTGDRFDFTFSQAIDTTNAGPITGMLVCGRSNTSSNDTIKFGPTSCTSNTVDDSTLGFLNLSGNTWTGSQNRSWTGTVEWQPTSCTDSCTGLRVWVTGSGTLSTPYSSGTFQPSALTDVAPSYYQTDGNTIGGESKIQLCTTNQIVSGRAGRCRPTYTINSSPGV